MEKVSVAVAPTAAPTTSTAPSTAPADHYLTITAITQLENVRQSAQGLASDLQLLTFDAQFNDQIAAQNFTAPLLAYDVKSSTPNTYRTLGLDILKAYPIRTDSNQQVKVTFITKAVQANNVDRFLDVFQTLQKVAAAIPSAAGSTANLSPVVNNVLNTGAQLLDQYRSTNTTYTDAADVTLNSPQYQQLNAEALILLPTSGSAEKYADRLRTIRNASYVLCTDAAGGDTLCVKDATGAPQPYTTYPYILLKPSVSYRVSHPDFIWLKLPAGTGAACTLTASDAERYESAILQEQKYLTAEQYALERLLDHSTRSLLDIQDALNASTPNVTKVFTQLNVEWAEEPPSSGLYVYQDGGRSYADAETQLRNCMIAQANVARPGLFSTYRQLLDLINQPMLTNAASQTRRDELILTLIAGLQENLTTFNVDAPAVKALLDGQRDVAEQYVYNVKFAPPIDTLHSATASATDKQIAKQQLLQLVQSNNPCTSCVKRANEALSAANVITAAQASVTAEAAAATAALSGTVVLATTAGGVVGRPVDTSEATQALTNLRNATKDVHEHGNVDAARQAITHTIDVTHDLSSHIQTMTTGRPPSE